MWDEMQFPHCPLVYTNFISVCWMHISLVCMHTRYKSCIGDWVDYVLNEAKYTPKGMIYIDQWGTLRHASNVAHACAQLTHLGLWEEECDAFIKSQGFNGNILD